MSTSPLRVLLVEDERAAREELKYLLAGLPGVEVVGEAADGRQLLLTLQRLQPDALFLDIQLPGESGLQLAEGLKARHPELQIVFATAYDEHAVEAFDLDATDYLLKPFDPERVARAVARLQAVRQARLERERSAPEARLSVERRNRTVLLDPAEVAWLGMEDGLVTVAAVDGVRYGTDRTLRELEGLLDPTRFFRCHRERIVNLQRVREVRPHQSGTFRLLLDDLPRSEIPLARNRARRLRERLQL